MTHSKEQLLLANLIDWLDQGDRFLGRLTPHQYTLADVALQASSLGSHYRHVLEHVRIPLDTPLGGTVDYDRRKRDTATERCLASAQAETRHLIARLEQLDPDTLSAPVWVSQDAGPTWKDQVVRSTLERELVFAMSHCVHHFAIMALLARVQGVHLPACFGVMPSTLDARLARLCRDVAAPAATHPTH